MPGPLFLEGEHVTLRTVEEEDLEFLQRDINAPEVRRSIGSVAPVNAAQEQDWFEHMSEDDGVSLLICTDEEPVGTIALSDINETWGHAEVGYWVTPDSWGEGYATEATELLVGYGFDQLRLNKVVAHAFAFNAGSQRVLEKVGFTEEGIQREEIFVNGEFVDVHRYGLLAREWRTAQAE